MRQIVRWYSSPWPANLDVYLIILWSNHALKEWLTRPGLREVRVLPFVSPVEGVPFTPDIALTSSWPSAETLRVGILAIGDRGAEDEWAAPTWGFKGFVSRRWETKPHHSDRALATLQAWIHDHGEGLRQRPSFGCRMLSVSPETRNRFCPWEALHLSQCRLAFEFRTCFLSRGESTRGTHAVESVGRCFGSGLKPRFNNDHGNVTRAASSRVVRQWVESRPLNPTSFTAFPSLALALAICFSYRYPIPHSPPLLILSSWRSGVIALTFCYLFSSPSLLFSSALVDMIDCG